MHPCWTPLHMCISSDFSPSRKIASDYLQYRFVIIRRLHRLTPRFLKISMNFSCITRSNAFSQSRSTYTFFYFNRNRRIFPTIMASHLPNPYLNPIASSSASHVDLILECIILMKKKFSNGFNTTNNSENCLSSQKFSLDQICIYFCSCFKLHLNSILANL